jgi:hypothetical protein
MTFNPAMQKAVETVEFESVCEFGNQRYTGPGNFPSTKAFYESRGCKRYLALDVNESMDAIVADLNHPVELGEQFDLVTNNGTGEHIFDQRMVFENAHNLSREWMIHMLPFSPWINHGFYNFNPILFRDLAYANEYDANIYITDRWGRGIALPSAEMFREKRPRELIEAVISISGDVSVVAVFKKTNDEPFRLPFQGKYQKDIQSDALKDRYGKDVDSG